MIEDYISSKNHNNNNNDKMRHLVSLNAKNTKLIPLKVYKQKQASLIHQDDIDDEDENSCYYDIKIKNELNEELDYKLVKNSNLLSKSCLSIPFEVSNNKKKLLNSCSPLSTSLSMLSSASQVTSSSQRPNKSFESTDLSLSSSSNKITSTSVSSLSSSSSVSSINNQNQLTAGTVSTDNSSSALRVEYMPRGKIITINVSIMW